MGHGKDVCACKVEANLVKACKIHAKSIHSTSVETKQLVADEVLVKGDLTVQGETCLQDVRVKGDLAVDGKLTFDGCLEPVAVLKTTASIGSGGVIECPYTATSISLNLSRTDNQVAPVVPDALVDVNDQTIAQGDSLALGDTDLAFRNVDGDGVITGPFKVADQDGSKAIICGIAENYTTGFPDDQEPPFSPSSSIGQLRSTAVIPGIRKIVDLNIAYSTEFNYDFLIVSKNGQNIATLTGFGPSAADPYLFVTLSNVVIDIGDVIEFRYTKDFCCYSGIDQWYLKVNNVRTLAIPQFPTQIQICRNMDTLLSIDACQTGEPLNDLNTFLLQLSAPLELEIGDTVKIITDELAFSVYDALLCFQNEQFLLRHTQPEEYTKKLSLNDVVINYQMTKDPSVIGGWYETDIFAPSLVWVQDNGTSLTFTSYAYAVGGPEFIIVPIVGIAPWNCVGDFLYEDSATGIQYVFDSTTGSFEAVIQSVSDVALVTQVVAPRFLRPILAPNEELWKYEQRLTDPAARFNNPVAFLDFVYNFFQAGTMSGWTERSKQIEGSPNPEGLDLTQVARTVGSATVDEYDDLYTQLKQTGILREYKVKQAVYWPYPGTVADESLKAQTRYFINQNRYNFLAFILDYPQLSTRDFPRLCPGETVQLWGTGVPRLEEQPLRLATAGYHTGPLAPLTHGPAFSHENWAYYTFRLPMVITESNNTIRSSLAGGDVLTFELPLGTHYFGDITDFIGSAFINTIFALLDGVDLMGRGLVMDLQIGRYNGDQLADFFGAEFITGLANLQASTLLAFTGLGLGDIVLYGPDHPEFASSFFGLLGMDIGSKFPVNQEIVVVDNGVFDIVPAITVPIQEYKPHTPLTESELQTLVSNLSSVKLSKLHGPIRNGMAADNLVACALELNMAHSSEVHQNISPWTKKCESGLDELFLDFGELTDRLNSLDITNDQIALGLYPFQFDPFVQVIPGIRQIPLNASGQGDFAELSEKYRAGGNYYSRTIQGQTLGYNYITWNAVRNTNLYYPPGTVLPGFGNVSNRENETVVTYLKEAFWMTTGVGLSGEPTFDLAEYETNSSLWTTMVDGSAPPVNPDAVSGNWMVGIMKDVIVQRAFQESGSGVPDPLPVYGYITHDVTSFSSAGDPTQLPWYDPEYEIPFIGSIAAAVGFVARIFQYFNANGVTHIIFDQRTCEGGGSPVVQAICLLSGGDRSFNTLSMITEQFRLNQNGVEEVYDSIATMQQGEIDGIITYPVLGPLGLSTVNDCKPSVYEAAGVPADGFFRGTVDQPRNIMWINPNSTISATQYDLYTIKGTSLNQETYDGDLGSNTCVAVYGSYTLPFSTAGGYFSIVDYYGKSRTGEETTTQPPMFAIDRFEAFRDAMTDANKTLLAPDQSFNQLIRPHILWDMNADVWFQDIGFVKGSPSVVPAVDGEPWVVQRSAVSNFVNYNDVSTWRDAIMDRTFVMAADPNLKDNFYAQNSSYGFVADPAP